MNNTALFDNIEFNKKVETLIKATFNSSEWINKFGGNKIKCYSPLIFKVTQFPNFSIATTSTPALIHQHSTQINQFSRVVLDINIYTVTVGDIDRITLGEEIAYKIKQTLQIEYGIPCVSDTAILNADEQIYRKFLSFSFTYDNINKIFFRGE